MSNEIQKQELPISVRFTNAVLREFSLNVGDINFGPYETKLAKHLFIKIDMVLAEANKKRDKDATPVTWENVNMVKLAVDSVYRIQLGLDALVENHIHPIPYWNNRSKKYDIDLRIGYVGKDFYRRTIAEDSSVDTRYELVYSTDKFVAKKKSSLNPIEDYEFEITNPFDRGDVIGGFGYISYNDKTKNKLILVTPKDFKKSENASKSNAFWGENKHRENMQFKTIVHRTTDHIKIDPRKMTAAVAAAEASDDRMDEEIAENANKEVIDIRVEETDQPQLSNTKEPIKVEMPGQPEPDLVGAGTGSGNGGNGGSTAMEGPDF